MDVRACLPADMLYLRDAFPRERWTEALPETAAFWLQMHAGFRAQQRHMADAASRWRSGALDPRGPFDWLVMYCMCHDADDGMSERMERVMACFFDAETGSTAG